MTKEQCLVFYPLTIRIGDDSNSYKSSILGVVDNQTDKQWNKLIIELKRCFKTYEDICGIKGSNIERYKKKFVKCKVKVINQEIFKKYEEKYNFGGVVASFINHDLNSSDYPSFYKDNMLEQKYTYHIKEFVVVEVKKVK